MPPEQGLAAGQGVGAEPGIFFNRVAHRLDQRHDPHLAALALDAQPLRHRHICAGETERFRDAQARAVQQRQHRHIPRGNPRVRIRLGFRFVQDILCRIDRDRPGQTQGAAGSLQVADLGILDTVRARQPAIQRLDRGQEARNRGVRQPVPPARGKVGADVACLEVSQCRQARLPAKMAAQEAQKAGQVGSVGFHGLCRHAALLAEMGQEGGQDVHAGILRDLP